MLFARFPLKEGMFQKYGIHFHTKKYILTMLFESGKEIPSNSGITWKHRSVNTTFQWFVNNVDVKLLFRRQLIDLKQNI